MIVNRRYLIHGLRILSRYVFPAQGNSEVHLNTKALFLFGKIAMGLKLFQKAYYFFDKAQGLNCIKSLNNVCYLFVNQKVAIPEGICVKTLLLNAVVNYDTLLADKDDIEIIYINLSRLCFKEKNFQQAGFYLLKSYTIQYSFATLNELCYFVQLFSSCDIVETHITKKSIFEHLITFQESLPYKTKFRNDLSSSSLPNLQSLDIFDKCPIAALVHLHYMTSGVQNFHLRYLWLCEKLEILRDFFTKNSYWTDDTKIDIENLFQVRKPIERVKIQLENLKITDVIQQNAMKSFQHSLNPELHIIACGSCGTKNLDTNDWKIADKFELQIFLFSDDDVVKLNEMGNVRLSSGKVFELRDFVNYFRYGDQYFHLYRELVACTLCKTDSSFTTTVCSKCTISNNFFCYLCA